MRTSPSDHVDAQEQTGQIADVVDEIVQRMQAGEPVSWESYCQQYPQYATQLRELQPAMEALVDLTTPELPPVDSESVEATPSHTPPRTLGDFRLVREIGRGGMGIVYEAEQVSLGRRVALKVLPMAGLLDPRQLQRFKNEARAAASLNHTHIVPVHSVGVEQSVHFYSMQLIRGQTLSAYLQQIARHHELPPTGEEQLEPSKTSDGAFSDLSTSHPEVQIDTIDLAKTLTQGSLRSDAYLRRVAELGSHVAEALDYAHSVGIIHRDIKPSNLLLDEQGKIWVTDFGLAQLETDTGITKTGDLLGTLRYMSPEQALGQRGQVDGRTDIYSLGITLYELLAGRPAFSGTNRQSLLRQVIEQEPVPLRRRNPSVPRDLETIIHKSIAKDAPQRYPNPKAMAEDLRRFLDHQTIRAKRPTLWDRSHKWLRRHPALVTATMLVLFTIAVATSISTLLISAAYENEARLRKEAQDAYQREQQQRQIADSERAKAEAAGKIASEEVAVAKAVNEFLQKDLLGMAGAEAQLNSQLEPDPDIKLATLLDRALAHLDDRFANRPKIRAEVQNSLAASYFGLGRYQEAERLWRDALKYSESTLGAEHPGTLKLMSNLAATQQALACYSDAEMMFKRCLETRCRVLGPEHPDTLNTMNELASCFIDQGNSDEASPLVVKCLEIRSRVLGPEHPDTLNTMHNQAIVYELQGLDSEAERVLTKCLEIQRRVIGNEHPSTLVSMNDLANLYVKKAGYAEAEALYTESLDIVRRIRGPEHPTTLSSISNLANLHLYQSRYDEAESELNHCMEIKQRVYGPEHPRTLVSMNDLAWLYSVQGKFGEAESLYKKCLDIRSKILGADHADTFITMNDLATLYATQARYSEAELLLTQCLNLSRKSLGPEHPTTLSVMGNLGGIYWKQSSYDDAESVLNQCLEISRRVHGPEHPFSLRAMSILASVFHSQAKYNEAERLLNHSLEIQRRVLGETHDDTRATMNSLALLYQSQGKYSDAKPLLTQCLLMDREILGPEHPSTLLAMSNLASLFVDEAKYDEAEPILTECLEITQRILGPENPQTVSVLAKLGMNHARAGRLDESLPLLEQAYRASREHRSLAWVAEELTDSYLKAGMLPEVTRLMKERIESARLSLPKDSPELASELALASHILLQTQQWSDAEDVSRECLTSRQRQMPDDWRTFNTQAQLGGALLGQKRYAEAEPLLLAGCEGMTARKQQIPPDGMPRFTEALERLVQLYSEWEKPEQAAMWQEKLESHRLNTRPPEETSASNPSPSSPSPTNQK